MEEAAFLQRHEPVQVMHGRSKVQAAEKPLSQMRIIAALLGDVCSPQRSQWAPPA